MVLSPKLESEFDTEHTHYEDSKSMKYVTNIERRGRAEGRQEGRQEGQQIGQIRSQQESVLAVLETRFSDVPYALREAVTGVDDLARLKEWHRLAIQLPNLEEFQKRLHER